MSFASLNLGCIRTFPMMSSPYLGISCFVLTEIVMVVVVGGGGLVYVSLLFSVTLHPLPPPSLELISFSIHLNKIQFCICVFYRPPNSPRCIFDTLSSYLVSICANNFHNFIFIR